MPQTWSAPSTDSPITATVRVPGSKSITNRALVLAALADQPSTITHPLRSRDTNLMADALRALGVSITDEADGAWQVVPDPLRGPADIDCGLAGTVMRFVPPAAAIAKGEVRFDGEPRARERPMGTVLHALRALGAQIEGDGLPFTLSGRGSLPGGEVTIDASASSQFVSGLLLSAARYVRGITLRHAGPPMPSLPHIEMTVHMLRESGVDVVTVEPDTWHVEPATVEARDRDVEPDLSNATPFLAAAAVTGGTVTIPDWPAGTTQPGDAIRAILGDMGVRVDHDDRGLTVTGTGGLSGVDIDMHEVGELTPTVAALAVFADGSTHLRGIAHLRGHETDRLATLATEINGLGGSAEETADGLVIRPAKLRGGAWHANADHRMATAGAVIGLRVPGVEVDDIGCTAKTLPDFPRMWTAMLAGGR